MCALLGLLMVVSFVPSASAVDAPTWTNGQEWAWGGEVSLSPTGEQIDQIEQAIESMPGASLDQLSMDGSMEAYVYCHVLNQTDSDYLVEMVLVTSVTFDGHAQLRAQMQKAGTYGIFEEVPTEEKTISLTANIDAMVFERFTMTVEKSTLAIKQATSETEVELELDVEVTNIPETEWENMNVTYSYTSYDVSMDLEMAMNMNATFDPYLDIYDFPLNVGDEWYVASQMTVEGNLEGTYSASGLPDDLESGFFDPDYGAISYPLDLSKYTGDLGDFHITNGVLDTQQMDLAAEMHCVSTTTVDDPEYGSITVYVINMNENEDGDPEGILYYSPDVKFFSSLEATSEAMSELPLEDITDISPVGLTSDESLAMEAIAPEEAIDNIESISGNSIFGGSDGGDTDTDGGSDMTMIFAVVIVGIVLAAIIVAVVFMRKKKA